MDTLSAVLASSTSLITDNTGTIISYFFAIVSALVVIVLGKKALFWVFGWLKGIFRK